MSVPPGKSQLLNGSIHHGQTPEENRRAGAALSVRLMRHMTQDTQGWLRPILVIGPLLVSAILATVASSRQLMLFAVLILSLGMFLAFVRWTPAGLVVTAVAGLVVPFRGPSGLSVTMLLVAALLGLWFLDMTVRQRDIRLVSSRTMLPLLAFVAVAFLSFAFGQLPWFAFANNTPLDAQLGGLSITVLSAVAFLLVANQVNDLTWLSRLTWTFLALAAISFAGRTFLPLFGLSTRDLFPIVGSLFYVWALGMALSQAIFNRDLRQGWRIALAGLVLVAIYILFALKFGDKSGWLPALVTLSTIVVFRSRPAGLALILGGLLLAVYILPEAVAVDRYSISTRLEAWLILAQIIQLSPIWGLGFANYYSFTPLFPIRGYAVSFNSHNNYIDIVAQMGLVGLACFAWFFLEVGRLGWRLRDQTPTGFGQAYVYGALGGLAGTAVAGMLGDWVVPFVYNIGLDGFRSSVLAWIFLGGLVSLEQMTKRENSPG